MPVVLALQVQQPGDGAQLRQRAARLHTERAHRQVRHRRPCSHPDATLLHGCRYGCSWSQQPHRVMSACATAGRMVLESPRFEDFFQMVEVPNFEIASDAFQTFKVQA
jgi:Mo25-like